MLLELQKETMFFKWRTKTANGLQLRTKRDERKSRKWKIELKTRLGNRLNQFMSHKLWIIYESWYDQFAYNMCIHVDTTSVFKQNVCVVDFNKFTHSKIRKLNSVTSGGQQFIEVWLLYFFRCTLLCSDLYWITGNGLSDGNL